MIDNKIKVSEIKNNDPTNIVLCTRVILKLKCRIYAPSTFNDVHGKNKHSTRTPDVFSATTNRFLFTYYSLTVSVKNVLTKQNTYYHNSH